MATTLILPGLQSSGPSHWQTWLEERVDGAIRVNQQDWRNADLAQWSARARAEIVRAEGPFYIVAHSFGALAAAQAASDHATRIAGALLVAPADPRIFGIEDFIPKTDLQFPAIVVASTNDPWMPFEAAEALAGQWGADLVNAGAAGHINAAAGYGPWPQALELLGRLAAEAEFRRHSQRVSARIRAQATAPRLGRRSATAGASLGSRVAALKHAAALLRAAGWTVAEPPRRTVGAR